MSYKENPFTLGHIITDVKFNIFLMLFSTTAPKLQRVVAPRRPTDAITTSSWRTGQQTVKRILGPSKKTKTSPEGSRPHSRSSQDTDISESNSLNFHWKGEDEGRKSSSLDDGKNSRKASSTKDAVLRKVSTEHQEHTNGTKKDSGWSFVILGRELFLVNLNSHTGTIT